MTLKASGRRANRLDTILPGVKQCREAHPVPETPGVIEARFHSRILGVIWFFLLCGIFFAGLKPFRAPRNEVNWLPDSSGLHFGDYGTVLSSGEFPPTDSGEAERSLEFWIQPGLAEDSNTILSFYRPGAVSHLAVHQSENDLAVQIEPSSAWRRRQKVTTMYVEGAFRDKKSAFWAVTSGPTGTVIYRDGAVVAKSPKLRPSSEEFSGRLVVGTSPIYNADWSGVLRGLAIYDRFLTGAQIARHYETWTKRKPVIAAEDGCIALYLLDERAGRIVHNKVASGNDLFIPPEYLLLDQTVLDPVWVAFNWSRGFWTDALINIGGFIPLGCFFCAYLAARGVARPVLTSSVLCVTVSLLIELVQSHLPTRDSSMSDVLANAAGSMIGAVIYRGIVARVIESVITCVIHIRARLSGGAWEPRG